MSDNTGSQTAEITDEALDAVSGGVAGLSLQGAQGALQVGGGADLAGHMVAAGGAADLRSGRLQLNAMAV